MHLKSAYQSVLRDKLLTRLRTLVSGGLENQIEHLLAAKVVSAVGDNTGNHRTMGRGVTQGSPLSPSLFNVYIDTLIEETNKSCITMDVSPTLFEDEVIAFAAIGTEFKHS